MEERKTIYLCLAHMSEAGLEQKYVKEAFDTNWVVPLGPNVNGFEEDFEKHSYLRMLTVQKHHMKLLHYLQAQLPFTWHCWHAVWVKVMKYVYKVSRSVPLLIR